MIILEKVLHRFEIFDAVEEIAHSKALQAIRERYTRMLEAAKHTRTELYKKPSIQVLENTIINDMLHARKYDIIHELQQGGFITIKTAQALDEAYIEHESFRA